MSWKPLRDRRLLAAALSLPLLGCRAGASADLRPKPPEPHALPVPPLELSDVPRRVGDREPSSPVRQQIPLRGRRERALPGKPEGLCSGDFDGDGRVDLAATLVSPGALLVWHTSDQGLEHEFERRPCGDFPLPPIALPEGRFGAGEAAQGIAVASRGARTLELFGGAARALQLEKTPRALAAGGSGPKTLLAVACDGRRLEILRDDAQEFEHWTLQGDLPRCALVSHGSLAVLVGFQDSTAIEAYDGESGEPIGRIELGGIPRAMAELDIDGDNDRELVVAGGDRELWIFGAGRSGGARVWFDGEAPLIFDAEAIPTALAVGDLDGEAGADLAVLNDFSLSLQVLTRLSDPWVGRETSLYAGQTPLGLALLDCDADGRLDVAIGNRDTEGLGLLAGDGAGALDTGTVIPIGSFPQALAVARTGSPESALRLAALNVKSNSISPVVFENGALRPLTEVACGTEPRAPVLAEFDGEPGLDLLLLCAGQRGTDFCVYHGDVDGRLSPTATLELGAGASDIEVLDVDRDGAFEFAIAMPQTGRVLLLENSALRGDLAALTQAQSLDVPSLPRELTTIELDGDPGPELACVLGAPGERVGIAWLDVQRESSGELVLTELGFSALPGAPSEAVACDLDGDGRTDLAVLATRATDSSVGFWFALLRGPGGPTDFRSSTPFGTSLLPRGITAADLDGDGRAEVFVAVQNSTLVQVWTPLASSAGAGLRMRALDSLGAGRGPFDLCIADVDGDGLLDLCIANAFSNDLSVLHGTQR